MNREEHLSREFPTKEGKTYIQSLDEYFSTNIKIMATLETQYKDFLVKNPTSTFTFEEWKNDHGVKIGKAIQRSSSDSKMFDEIRTPE